MTINNDYEVSSEGAVRHWEIPYAHLEHNTPEPTFATALLSQLLGTQVCGTVLTIDAQTNVAVIDFTCGMVYQHSVRTVTTYAKGAESAWAQIAIGDVVYYDRSVTMPAGTFLSKAAADAAVGANPIFGYIVPQNEVDMALYPKGIAIAPGSTEVCGVMQRGAGA